MSGKGDPPKSILKKSVKVDLGKQCKETAVESRDLSQTSLGGSVRKRIISSWYQASENILLSLLMTVNELFINTTSGQIQEFSPVKPICTPSALS